MPKKCYFVVICRISLAGRAPFAPVTSNGWLPAEGSCTRRCLDRSTPEVSSSGSTWRATSRCVSPPTRKSRPRTSRRSPRTGLRLRVRMLSYKLKHACLTRPFIKEATQKGQSKEHCMLIKSKQNISSQSFLRHPSTRKQSFQFVCWLGIRSWNIWIFKITGDFALCLMAKKLHARLIHDPKRLLLLYINCFLFSSCPFLSFRLP